MEYSKKCEELNNVLSEISDNEIDNWIEQDEKEEEKDVLRFRWLLFHGQRKVIPVKYLDIPEGDDPTGQLSTEELIKMRKYKDNFTKESFEHLQITYGQALLKIKEQQKQIEELQSQLSDYAWKESRWGH